MNMKELMTMDFPERLVFLRKKHSLTQQTLADLVGIHVSQLKRYEAGTSQPTLDVLRRLSVSLSVSSDVLLFDSDERGPDDEFKLYFEAASRLSNDDRQTIIKMINALVVKQRVEGVLSPLGS